MTDAVSNFGYSTVSAAPAPAGSGTTLKVNAGGNWPTPPFNVVVWPAGAGRPTAANAEIVRVTATGATWTIERKQEGTSAREIQVGDQIMEAVTAKTLTDRNVDPDTVISVFGRPGPHVVAVEGDYDYSMVGAAPWKEHYNEVSVGSGGVALPPPEPGVEYWIAKATASTSPLTMPKFETGESVIIYLVREHNGTWSLLAPSGYTLRWENHEPPTELSELSGRTDRISCACGQATFLDMTILNINLG